MDDNTRVLHEMLETKVTYDKDGKEKKITGGISKEEVAMLISIIKDIKPKHTLETGVAFGVSTLAITSSLPSGSMHYGVDPCQFSEHNGAAISALEKSKLEDKFTLLEGPSHLMIPTLINKNVKIDFALIDGWHTFDYTLVDFFLIDKILNKNGIIAIHDMDMLSKQKVLGYILTHREYKIMEEYIVKNDKPLYYLLARFLKNVLKNPSKLFNMYWLKYQTRSTSSMFVIQKSEDYEPNHDFYKNF